MKFTIRYIRYLPHYAYAEVEADNLEEALDMLEDEPDEYEFNVDKDEAPSAFDEVDLIDAHVLNDAGEYVSCEELLD